MAGRVRAIAAACALLASLCIPVVAHAQSKAIPRTADGKPDFTGVWAGPGFSHKVGAGDTDSPTVSAYNPKLFTPFAPGGEALFRKKLTGNTRTDDPTSFCLPNGLTRQILSPYAQQWIQAPKALVIAYEYMHFFRIIPIGAPNRPHDKDVDLTWMGDSIAWWDGDTLVIDTVGLKAWQLDASLDVSNELKWHSDALHVIERVAFTDASTASYKVTIDDPKIFTAPWTQEFGMKLHPTWKILEFVCEENNRCMGGQCAESDVQK